MPARPPRRAARAGAGLVAALCVVLLLGSALAGPATVPRAGTPAGPDPSTPDGTDVAGSGPGEDAEGPGTASLTVVSTQGTYLHVHPGARDVAELVAYDGDGSVVYRNATYQAYFDVDPVPGTRATVEYVAARKLGGDDCPNAGRCTRNLVERANLSTGDVTRVFDRVTSGFDGSRWHDADRLNETHVVVADLNRDRVFVVDVRADELAWQWNASDHYPLDAGGPQSDWTHLNDVEPLADGRIVASVRNMDQVVFLEPGTGVVDEWTLGSDDERDTLHEQHNPDYIPPDRGGPALLVADSENNRVVEYRREGDAWTRSWSWRDRSLQWPRDADRLPGGNTLVVDSHGDRVLEMDTAGAVVWSVDVGMAYDAERLGTGDESATGYAAGTSPAGTGPDGAPLGAPPAADQRGIGGSGVVVALKDALPPVAVNGLLYLAPPWVRFTDLLVVGVLLLDVLAWGALEWRWSGHSVRNGVRRGFGRVRAWLR